MTKDTILTDLVKPIAEYCSPLRVKVSARVVKDRYYIHFDGSATYSDPAQWNNYWQEPGFEHYVKHVLRRHKFENTTIKMKHDTHAVVFIGTLFSFLSAGSKANNE